jgi:hypothetical protein
MHDQVTARLCIEYFTSPAAMNHQMLLYKLGLYKKYKNNPTVIAFVFGTLCTWYVGSIGGSVLCLWNSLVLKKDFDLIRVTQQLGLIGIITSSASALAYITGYVFGTKIFGSFNGVPLEQSKHAKFQGVALSHLAAYTTGIACFLGLLFVQ